MPVKRRQSRRRRRREWRDEHRIALGSGQRYFDAFDGHRNPWPMDEARTAWSELGDEIMEDYRVNRPALRPWGWWTFGPPGCELPCGKAAQRRYLLDHGYLSPAELAMIEADPALLEPTPLEAWMGCK